MPKAFCVGRVACSERSREFVTIARDTASHGFLYHQSVGESVESDYYNWGHPGRERLVDTALKLCYQHGFHAIGVDRIAKEAGTTRATLYNHFESKDDLVLAVVAKRDAWWQETFRGEIESRGGADPLAQLRSVPEILRDWFATDGFNGCLFINTTSEFPSPRDPVHQAAKANVDAIRKVIAEIAARAGIQNAESFARQFNMIIEGAIVTEVIDRDGLAPDTAAQLAEALIEQHLGADQRRVTPAG